MIKVKIKPVGQRAKNRVREHGEVMELVSEESYQLQLAIFVKSLGPTCADGTHWFGWIDQAEADWDIL